MEVFLRSSGVHQRIPYLDFHARTLIFLSGRRTKFRVPADGRLFFTSKTGGINLETHCAAPLTERHYISIGGIVQNWLSYMEGGVMDPRR